MIVVALKWAGTVSPADGAALEIALRLDEDVTAVTAGPSEAEGALRLAVAAGATRAVRIDSAGDLRSEAVARVLAPHCADATWVICGDASIDRGSGAVPAFLAAHLGVGQALGLVAAEATDARALRVVRRLDGGRREVLDARAPCVLSVEGSLARLRRASLPAELAAGRAGIDVVPGPAGPVDRPTAVRPYRPRPRVMAIPSGGALARISQLTAASATPTRRSEGVVLDPAPAAELIMETLQTWGYVDAEGRSITS